MPIKKHDTSLYSILEEVIDKTSSQVGDILGYNRQKYWVRKYRNDSNLDKFIEDCLTLGLSKNRINIIINKYMKARYNIGS